VAGAEAAPGAPLTHGGRRSGAARTPGALTLSEDDRRVLAGWAADCAQQALPLLETHAPDDMRPRDAIAGAEWAEEHASPQSAPSCAGYRPDAGPVGRSAP
jgi:hypothetical protein